MAKKDKVLKDIRIRQTDNGGYIVDFIEPGMWGSMSVNEHAYSSKEEFLDWITSKDF
jgi:hypothetical protein